MTASHGSLANDFEVSGPELDAMVQAASRVPSVLGARMTGAGFAGCAIALVPTAAAERAGSEIALHYQQATGIAPRVYPCTASDGASCLPPAAAA